MIEEFGMSGLLWKFGSIGVLIDKAIAGPVNTASHRYAPPCRALERAKRTGSRMTMFMPDVNRSPAVGNLHDSRTSVDR